MQTDPTAPTSANAGATTNALSNEVLKLKVDDLFQEVESLKRRMDRLESQPNRGSGSASGEAGPVKGVVSNPDCR